MGGTMARPCGAPVREDRLRHLEGLMPPAGLLPRALAVVLAEGRAVGRGRARFAWRAVTDDGAAGDQRGTVGHLPRVLDGKGDCLGVVTVNAGGVPVRGLEP